MGKVNKDFLTKEIIISSTSIPTFPPETQAAKIYADYIIQHPEASTSEIKLKIEKVYEEGRYFDEGSYSYYAVIYKKVTETKEEHDIRVKKEQEEEDNERLLYIDLCSRLPYGVMCEFNTGKRMQLTLSDLQHIEEFKIKPLLRHKLSMTQEEIKKYNSLRDVENFLYFDTPESLDYLNSIQVDYRGLIGKGIAKELNIEN